MKCSRKIAGFFAVFFIAILPVIVGSTAKADSMPWSGASARVSVLEPTVWNLPQGGVTRSQTGSTAAASATRDAPITYLGVNYTGGTLPSYTVTVHGSADAQATGRAADLLYAGANYSSPNPGTRPQITQGAGPVEATASWTGDRVSIQGPSLPDMVRLNFAVNMNSANPAFGTFGGLEVGANGQIMSLGNHYYTSNPYSIFHQGFDSVSDTVTSPSGLGPLGNGVLPYSATFHIDLPVNVLGQSDPFQLSLKATPDSGLSSNYPITSGLRGDAIVSLTSITTTDGKQLSDLGDTVTFASGMLAPGSQPAPVPEPSTVAMFGLFGVSLIGRAIMVQRRKSA